MVIGDYNYYYDGSAMLHTLAQQNQWRVGVLVDEAHNLLDRARKMYSASLDPFAFAAAREVAPAALRRRSTGSPAPAGQPRADRALCRVSGDSGIVSAVQNLVAAIGEHLTRARANGDALLRFHFEAIQFGVLAEAFDSASIFDATLHGEPMPRQPALDGVASAGRRRRVQSTLCVRNVIPAGFRAAARATVLFSGTLARFISIATRRVARRHGLARRRRAVPRRATDGARREPRVDALARPRPFARTDRRPDRRAIRDTARQLSRLPEQLRLSGPRGRADADAASGRAVWAQAPGMAESERDAFARFDAGGRGVGFAVLGGAFSEGVDLSASG